MTAGVDSPTIPDSDRERQVFVTLAVAFCLVSALVGFGLLGQPVNAVAGRALASDATLLAPAQWAFLIWRPLYLGLTAYTVWQWWPAQKSSPVNRAIGWRAGWSMILAGGWVLITQRGWLWLGVVFMMALVVVVGRLVAALTDAALPPRTGVTHWLTDATFGVYLGWGCVAAVGMVAATFGSVYVSLGGADPWLGALVLALTAGIGIEIARRTRGSWWPTAGLGWGLVGIAWERSFGEPRSMMVAGTSLVAGIAVVVATAFWARERVRGHS